MTSANGRAFPLRRAAVIAATCALALAAAWLSHRAPLAGPADDAGRLPTGLRLDPAGHATPLGSMPLAMAWSPDSSRIAVLLCGYREQGLQIVDPARGQVTQTLLQPAAFLGLAFSPDGKSLFTSGGNQDVVYRYAWAGGTATLADSVALTRDDSLGTGVRYPAGLAFSPDGSRLYVCENLADSLAVVDPVTRRVVQQLPTGPYPYGVVVDPGGRVYVSAWGGSNVAVFDPADAGQLVAAGKIPVGQHPSAMALDAARGRLYVARGSYDRVAVVDLRQGKVTAELSVTPAGAPPEGGTPNALTLSADGARLYVGEADHNAVSVFDTGPAHALVGRVPVEWYPTAVLARGDMLYALNGKGHGTVANPRHGHPGAHALVDPRVDKLSYTLAQLTGSLSAVTMPRDTGRWKALSARVERADRWTSQHVSLKYPPFRHVIYVIRENRTYDQLMGDMPQGDGDTSLVYFGRPVTPNGHALAERFGLFDNFRVNAEVSGQGHNWSTAAYASDYLEKTIPSVYAGHGRSYDYEGLNRDTTTDDDVNAPGTGYIWDAAARAGVSMRNYGEFTNKDRAGHWVASKDVLERSNCDAFPGFDLDIKDQERVNAWLVEFARFVAGDSMPALTLMRLPNDHTAGASVGAPTPRAYVADNDLALGRMIEALSKSPFWKDTIVFVVEDDAQDGPDHVDSHRSALLVVSAWNKPGLVHRFVNTTDVLATIGAILKMQPMSQFDAFGWPIDGIFEAAPDLAPYAALRSAVSLDEKNTPKTPGAKAMGALDLRREDPPNEDLFNRILWAVIKGPERAYPCAAPRAASPAERSRP